MDWKEKLATVVINGPHRDVHGVDAHLGGVILDVRRAMMRQRDYDTTIARMAGNIAAGLAALDKYSDSIVVETSVDIARQIVAAVKDREAHDAALKLQSTD